jgi:hypothetical protein
MMSRSTVYVFIERKPAEHEAPTRARPLGGRPCGCIATSLDRRRFLRRSGLAGADNLEKRIVLENILGNAWKYTGRRLARRSSLEPLRRLKARRISSATTGADST